MKKDGSLSSLEAELEKLKAENIALRDREQQYRHFFEKAPNMIYVVDSNGFFININQAGARMMGYNRPEEIIGSRFQDHFFSNDSEFQSYKDKIHDEGAVKEFETTLSTKTGEILSVSLTGTMRMTLTNKLKGYEGFAIDITQRIDAEKIIKTSEKKYKAILDNSLAGIYMFQEGGHFSYVNKRFLNILGYDHPEEILGRKFWELISTEDRNLVKKRGLERENYEIQPRQYSYRMIRKDGSVIWVDMRSSHASYMGIPAAVGNFIDISKEKKAQKKIHTLSHKLIEGLEEERRSLALDLHDEFGQSLTLLQFDIERLQRMLPLEQNAPIEVSKKIMDQIQTLAEKVRNTTSRLRPDLLDHLGLVPTLQWYIQDFKERFQGIQVDFQAIGFKRRVNTSAEIVIYRIFQEGLNNVTKHSNATKVIVKLTASHPKMIFIIKDNGDGFVQDENGMPKDGSSLGIGLLSMKERVASLNGEIEIKSVLNKGTAIRVELSMG